MVKCTVTVWLVLLLSGCDLSWRPAGEAAAPIRLGTNLWPGYEPLYLARSLGLLDGDAIRLVEYPSASEVIRAFSNHSIEAAALTLDEALLLLQQQLAVRVVLVMDLSEGGDVVMARPDILSFSDLKGRVIGVESGALGAYVISRALDLNNLTLADVQVKSVPVSAHEQAYRRGEVDAVVTFEPVRSKLLEAGARELFSSRQIPAEIVDVLVVREDVLQRRRVALEQLLEGWFGALAYMEREPLLAARMMAERLGVSPREVRASYDGLRLPGRRENRLMLGGATPSLYRTMDKIHQIMVAQALLHREVELNGVLVDIQ